MAATIVGVFQPEMQNLITTTKILLVGAGGIGCEVLKNLVLTGFSELEVIDLDTIEVSNLNRQFLFSSESVGQPKSLVAKSSVLKFNPNVNIQAHFGDIMDQKYGSAFFNKFKLVINALDNKKARSHVNRMCLANDIPLIESGTMGLNGQVEFIKKILSSCYECLPKAEPKTYPMCTIRNTPREPIHCIIWAKFLFGQLFGEMDEDVSMEKPVECSEDTKRLTFVEWARSVEFDPVKLFKRCFIQDIETLKDLSLVDSKVNHKVVAVLDESILEKRPEYKHKLDDEVLDLSHYVSMFLDSVEAIRQKFKESNGILNWDKDDDDFMSFVVSTSNIRSSIFGIPFKSQFEIKTMAGNIIPAVATANAIIAGQIVIHALRILRGNFRRCQTVFLRSMPNHKGGIMVRESTLSKPNPKCTVCSTDGEIVIRTDVNKFTVKQLDDLVLKRKLCMVQPDVLADGRMIISSDEDDKLDLYSFTLADLNITTGTKLAVDDYFQSFAIKIAVYHNEDAKEEDLEFEIFSSLEEMKKYDLAIKKEEKSTADDDNDDCLMCDDTNADYNNKDNLEVQNGTEVSEDGNKMSNLENQEEDMAVSNNGEDMAVSNDGEDMAVSNDGEENGSGENASVTNEPEVSTEEILAMKRKAEEGPDDLEIKKSRVNE